MVGLSNMETFGLIYELAAGNGRKSMLFGYCASLTFATGKAKGVGFEAPRPSFTYRA